MARSTTSVRRRVALLGAALTAAMLLLGWAVSGPVPAVDVLVQDALRGQKHAVPGTLAQAWLAVFNPALPPIALVVLLVWALRERLRGRGARAGLLARTAVVLVAAEAEVLFKFVFQRPLPFPLPPGVHNYAYPSGHTTAATALAVTAVVLALAFGRRWWRRLAMFAGVCVLLTAVSLVVIGVHYATDVLGAALGATGVGLLVAVATGLEMRDRASKGRSWGRRPRSSGS